MTTPNEPNKTRTIPLHIADQAVAACQAEIQKLKEENARLKDKSACQTECLDAFDKKLREAEAEVERLRKAGDEMAHWLMHQDRGKSYAFHVLHDAVCAWHAAKEGKQS